jgi:hypothetical protein
MFDLHQLRLEVTATDSEYRGYFEAARQRQLVVQKCTNCELLRAAIGSGCPFCGSPEWQWEPVQGTGFIYSYQIVAHAVLPAFREWVPYPLVLVELDEQRDVPWPTHDPTGTVSLRIVAMLSSRTDPSQPADEESVAIGKRVEVCFLDINDLQALPAFRLSEGPPEHSPWRAPDQ